VTLVAGWASRTTVKVSAVPASVGAAKVFDTVTPADWAIATRGCELSSIERAVKRMANFLAEACHEVPALAIADN
jgi:fructose-specific component phosphotransferase system IIB-like protein